MAEVQAVRKAVEPALLEHEKVVGISHSHSKPKIVIYVESEEDVEAMPKVLSGIQTEIRVIGKVKIQQQMLMGVNIQKVRPLVGGVSGFACCERAAGTLGVVTYDGKILSNAHVCAIDFINSKWFEPGQPILQPSLLDGGSEEDVVGKLESYVPIEFNNVEAENYVDGAIATPTVDYVPGEIQGIGQVRGWSEPKVGQLVRKLGRTTGYTESVITDVGATIKVSGYPWGWAVFKDCIVCDAFSQAGDSGSIIITPDNIVVGLLFAGSDVVTIGCNIKHVIDKLGIDLGPVVEPQMLEPKPEIAVMGFFPLMFVGGIIIFEEISKV